MKTKLYIIIFLSSFGISISGQVLFSKTVNNPHANALLDIKDSEKGVIFTKADSIKSFPLYNANAGDLFDNLNSLEGAILYNKEDRQYYKYDGSAWIPALQLRGQNNTLESRFKVINDAKTWSCIGVGPINSCSLASLFMGTNIKSIPISNITNGSELLVNNLNIENLNGIVKIPNAGLYYISGVIGFTGNTLLNVGNATSYWISMDVSYDNGNNWSTLAFKETQIKAGVFIDNANVVKTTNVSSTVTLPANARIRLMALVSSTSGLISSYTNSTDHSETFINIQRLK